MITTQEIFRIELKMLHLKEQIEELNSKKQILDFETNKVDIFKIELKIWHLNEEINNLKLETEKSKQGLQKSIGTKK